MAKSKKICHHLHLPLQSGSSRILKAMNRRYDKEKYLNLVDKIRTAIPDISLTTDIIVGFPGETEEDFEETLDVVSKCGYDTAFTFYIPEEAEHLLPKWNRYRRMLQRNVLTACLRWYSRRDVFVLPDLKVLCRKFW